MEEKLVYARVSNLHATESEWTANDLDTRFIPDAGEFVIYDSTTTSKPPKIKIGDGTTCLKNLPFITEADDTTIFAVSPNAEITITAPSSNSFEVGSSVSCSASWSTDPGTYRWGTYANGEANFNDKATGIRYTNLESFPSTNVTIVEGDNKINFSRTITRSAIEKHPCSKLGEDLYNSLDIDYKSAKTLSVSAETTITGFRYAFGGTTDNDSLSSGEIRHTENSTAKKEEMDSESNSFEITAKKRASKVFFAYPASWSGTPRFQICSLGWVDETFTFVNSVNVAGASNDPAKDGTEYNVYMWSSLEPLLADTKFRMWI